MRATTFAKILFASHGLSAVVPAILGLVMPSTIAAFLGTAEKIFRGAEPVPPLKVDFFMIVVFGSALLTSVVFDVIALFSSSRAVAVTRCIVGALFNGINSIVAAVLLLTDPTTPAFVINVVLVDGFFGLWFLAAFVFFHIEIAEVTHKKLN